MARRLHILVALAGCLAAGSVQAEDVVITQEGKTFSMKEVTINAGESITFLNDDTVTHNVYSRSKGNKFDLGAQAPSSSSNQAFSSPGKVKVRCAIHPRMKLTVHVE